MRKKDVFLFATTLRAGLLVRARVLQVLPALPTANCTFMYQAGATDDH